MPGAYLRLQLSDMAYHALTTAQAMMTEARKLGSIAWRFPQEARSPSESAGPDQRSGYHHLANGQVVSKCALNIIKGTGSGFPKPIRSSVLLFRKTIEVVLQRLQIHIVRLSLRVRALRSLTRLRACASS